MRVRKLIVTIVILFSLSGLFAKESVGNGCYSVELEYYSDAESMNEWINVTSQLDGYEYDGRTLELINKVSKSEMQLIKQIIDLYDTYAGETYEWTIYYFSDEKYLLEVYIEPDDYFRYCLFKIIK